MTWTDTSNNEEGLEVERCQGTTAYCDSHPASWAQVAQTDRNIDYEVGLLSKRIETLQLWRVHDMDFRQSFMERLLGIARIQVFTKDTSDPIVVLRGLPASREIFDQLKDAAELARQQRVVGIVE